MCTATSLFLCSAFWPCILSDIACFLLCPYMCIAQIFSAQTIGVKRDAPVDARRLALLNSLLGVCTQRQGSTGSSLDESPLIPESGHVSSPAIESSEVALSPRVENDFASTGTSGSSETQYAATPASGVMSPRSRRGAGLLPTHHQVVRIFVKITKGKSIALDVDPQDNVKRIKQYIEKQCSIPAQSQMLLFMGHELTDDR